AAVAQPCVADALENSVEFGLTDFEGVVMPLEFVPVVEIEGQLLVDTYRGEVARSTLIRNPEDAGKEPRRIFLVAGGDDHVIEDNGHGSGWDSKSKPAPGPKAIKPRGRSCRACDLLRSLHVLPPRDREHMSGSRSGGASPRQPAGRGKRGSSRSAGRQFLSRVLL